MAQVGNFFELETAKLSKKWLKDKILLNSGRNALRYIIKAYNINKIAVPYYTCQFVWDILKQENCKINFYHIDKNFLPIQTFEKCDYILYNNYFGICDRQIEFLKLKYKNLIIDNTQAFYSHQKCLASFYSLRKFFGVPDGGLVWCDKKLNIKLEKSKSYHSSIHLLKAYDSDHESSYINFIKNELRIDKMPMQEMSNLTLALLDNINYTKCKNIRLRNFNILNDFLKNSNQLNIELQKDDVPMFYPYLNEDKTIIDRLKNIVYLVECWPQIDKFLSSEELYLKNNLMLLPIDQRYSKKDMNAIINVIEVLV